MHVSEIGSGEFDRDKLRMVARACACANLRKATRVVTQIYDEALAPSGLRCTQFTLLATTYLAGEQTMSGLAEKMVMDRTTLTRNLKPLVRDGLLEVVPGDDNRTRVVRIGPWGHHALAEAYPLWEAAQSGVVEALGKGRFEALLGGLGQTLSLRSDTLPDVSS